MPVPYDIPIVCPACQAPIVAPRPIEPEAPAAAPFVDCAVCGAVVTIGADGQPKQIGHQLTVAWTDPADQPDIAQLRAPDHQQRRDN